MRARDDDPPLSVSEVIVLGVVGLIAFVAFMPVALRLLAGAWRLLRWVG